MWQQSVNISFLFTSVDSISSHNFGGLIFLTPFGILVFIRGFIYDFIIHSDCYGTMMLIDKNFFVLYDSIQLKIVSHHECDLLLLFIWSEFFSFLVYFVLSFVCELASVSTVNHLIKLNWRGFYENKNETSSDRQHQRKRRRKKWLSRRFHFPWKFMAHNHTAEHHVTINRNVSVNSFQFPSIWHKQGFRIASRNQFSGAFNSKESCGCVFWLVLSVTQICDRNAWLDAWINSGFVETA